MPTKNRRAFIKAGGLAAGGLISIGNGAARAIEAGSAASGSGAISFTDAERNVLAFISQFGGGACYHGGCIAGDLNNPAEHNFADLLVRLDDPQAFAECLSGTRGDPPFESVYAEGNTLFFEHGEDRFTVQVLTADEFDRQLASIRAGATSPYAHSALTCPSNKPGDIADPLGATAGTAPDGSICVCPLDSRLKPDLADRFSALLDGLLDGAHHHLPPSAEFETFRQSVLSLRTRDRDTAGRVFSELAPRLAPLAAALEPGPMADLMASPIVATAAAAFGKPGGSRLGAEFNALRARLAGRFTDGAIWLAVLLHDEIHAGRADGVVYSDDRHAHLRSRADLALATEIVLGDPASTTTSTGTGALAETSFTLWSGTLSPSAPLDPGADDDKDGTSNLVEYALGMDPKIASTEGLPTSEVRRIGGVDHLILSYRRDLAKTDILYRVQTTTDLRRAEWTTDGVQDLLESTDGSIEQRIARVPMDSATRFLRLFVELR